MLSVAATDCEPYLLVKLQGLYSLFSHIHKLQWPGRHSLMIKLFRELE